MRERLVPEHGECVFAAETAGVGGAGVAEGYDSY
jgi:hypothetical protein